MATKSKIRICAEQAMEAEDIAGGRTFINHRAYGTCVKIGKWERPACDAMVRMREHFSKAYPKNKTEVSYVTTPYYNGYAGVTFKVFK